MAGEEHEFGCARLADHPIGLSRMPGFALRADGARAGTQVLPPPAGSSAGRLRGLFGGFLPRAAQPRRDRPLGVGRLRSEFKHLECRYEEDSIDLGRLAPALFSKVPVVFHELVDERQRMVMMGLHHITGKRRKRIPVIMRLQAHCERTAVRGNGTHTLSTRSSPSPIMHGSPATAVTGYVEPAGRRRRSRRKGSLKGPQAPCLTSRLPITIRDDRALRGGARVASSFNE